MPTDLSPAEKDDRQVERLINKKPPPSRKHRTKRGPKHDNRRRRMIDKNDPDVKAAERDRKASLADISLRVAFPDDEKSGRSFLLTKSILRDIADGIPVQEALASYEDAQFEAMSSKTAAYHGVVQQGHPSGPTNTGYKSYDRRYFGKAEYESIVAHAKELLKTDWLATGWDGGAEDAPFRAALDMAINLADSNLYQGKIDGETYNMLLARLTKSKADLFADTLITEDKPSSRSAATMNNMKKDEAISNMVRIANSLRKSDPRSAFEIMKNVQAIRVAQVPVESQVQHQAEEACDMTGSSDGMPAPSGPSAAPPAAPSPGGAPPGAGGGEQTGGLQKGGPNLKDVKAQLDLFSKARSGEELMDVLTKLAESVKTAGSRTASSALEELAPIADMSDEEIQKLVQMGQRDVTKLEDIFKGWDDEKMLEPEEVETFVKGMDDFINNIVGEADKLKTASVAVPIATLLRVAGISPEARLVMMPYLAAAKKKVEKAKKKGKKKPGKKKGGNPFAKGGPLSKGGPAKGGKKGPPAKGGKAPPFGGKKAPPFGKKKASVDITDNDSKW